MSIGIGVYLTQKPQTTKTSAAGVDLSLSSNSSNPQVGDTFTIALSMTTNGMSVSAGDIRVRYDDTKIQYQSFQAGTTLPTILKPAAYDNPNDGAGGRVWVILGAKVDTAGAYPQSGSDLLIGQMTFKAIAPGSVTLSYGSGSQVAATGQTTSVVGTMNPVSITIPGATNPPTATPTGCPTPTPSPSPTGSPTTPPVGPTVTPSPSGGSNLTGDINGDGVVDIIDLGILVDNYGKSPLPNPKADLNGDGKVDIVDFGILIDNYGK